jgi:hypothetical protein
MRNVRDPQQPPTPETAFTLACVRSYWQARFHVDLFVEYQRDPRAACQQLTAHFQGDLNSLKESIEDLKGLKKFLDAGFSPDAPPGSKIAATVDTTLDPRQTYLLFDLLVQNIGRTEVLLKDVGILRVGGARLNLKGLIETKGFDVFTGKYYKLPPLSVESITMTQDPDSTTLNQMTEIVRRLARAQEQAIIDLRDFKDRTHRSKRFRFEEFGE